MRYGVATAQRGWATKGDVLNTQPVSAIKKWVKRKRSGKSIDSTEQSIIEKIEYFKHPDAVFTLTEIIENQKIIPKEKGVYGWYFNTLPPYVPKQSYYKVGTCMLLYIGIAGKNKKSKGNLRSRIYTDHINGNAYGSTLRRALGSLLRSDLNLIPHKKGKESSKGFYFGEGENTLRNWLISNAKVAWIVDDNPLQIEDSILDKYGNLLPNEFRKK